MNMRIITISTSLLFSLIIFPFVVLAQDDSSDTTDSTRADRFEQRQENLQQRATDRQEKISEAKRKVCEKREQKINNIMARIADRTEKHLALFTKISDKTQAFYERKDLTINNYQQLLAEVDTKKVAAETAVAEINSNKDVFSCDDDNPKASITDFKSSLRSSIDVLKDYKDAVKNLVKAVRSANE